MKIPLANSKKKKQLSEIVEQTSDRIVDEGKMHAFKM